MLVSSRRSSSHICNERMLGEAKERVQCIMFFKRFSNKRPGPLTSKGFRLSQGAVKFPTGRQFSAAAGSYARRSTVRVISNCSLASMSHGRLLLRHADSSSTLWTLLARSCVCWLAEFGDAWEMTRGWVWDVSKIPKLEKVVLFSESG